VFRVRGSVGEGLKGREEVVRRELELKEKEGRRKEEEIRS
jgi:hypothetical protein